jgi:ribosome-associated protein
LAKKSGAGESKVRGKSKAREGPRAGRPQLRSSHLDGDVLRGEERAARVRQARRDLRLMGAPLVASAGPRTRKARPHHPAPAPAQSLASDEARLLAIAVAVAGLEKKAVGLEILDVAGKVDYADFLVIMTGRSDRQVQALAQGIEEALRRNGKRPLAVEGLPHATWVLMDFGDVVVHVFQDDARSLYDIEGLWMDARRIPVPEPEDLRHEG